MLIKKIFLLLLLGSFVNPVFSKDYKSDDIIGFWLTKKESAVIEVYKDGKEFAGKVVWLRDLHTGKKKEILDDKNKDKKLQKRSLLNLQNLKGFSFKSNKWSGGSIYDPESGKTYSANMELKTIDNLHLRGYVGIPMFGRTSKWKRQKQAMPDDLVKAK